MKIFTKLAVLLFASSVIGTSCNKDDDDPIAPQTTTSLLSAHEWILTNVTLGFPLNAINAWDSMPACDKDDFYKFDLNSTGYHDQGAMMCDTSDPQRDTYAWMWEDNETTIEIPADPADSSSTATIFKNVVVTATTMTAKTDWEVQGITATANLTFGVH